MEQIIPILIAAVIFGFQAYQNYQKEQEKARKRDPGKRPAQQQDGERTAADRPQQSPATREHQRTTQQPIPTPETAPVPAGYQEYAGVIDEEQLAHYATRSNRNQEDLLKPLEVSADEDDLVIESNESFDLRTAVIHATILERPHQ